MNTAFFGGSFNPVHNGHVKLAESVLSHADFIDSLYVVPAFVSPFKTEDEKDVGDRARLEMCTLAFEDIPKTSVSDYEIKRKKISYTVDTLRYFREKNPGDKLWFLVGSDSLETLPTWRGFEDIMKLCGIISAVRSVSDRQKIEKNAEKVRRYGEVILIDSEPFEISSTEIRKKLFRGEDVSGYLPEKVLKYINDNDLYR